MGKFDLIDVLCDGEPSQARPTEWDGENDDANPINCELCCSKCGCLVTLSLIEGRAVCECGCVITTAVPSIEPPNMEILNQHTDANNDIDNDLNDFIDEGLASIDESDELVGVDKPKDSDKLTETNKPEESEESEEPKTIQDVIKRYAVDPSAPTDAKYHLSIEDAEDMLHRDPTIAKLYAEVDDETREKMEQLDHHSDADILKPKTPRINKKKPQLDIEEQDL